MWDPRRYLDTDFGLAEHESFEPVEEPESDWAGITGPYVMTVLGPIAPDDLGVCQHFEHVSPADGSPASLRAVADELEAYFTVGGRAMVDVPRAGYRQDPLALRGLAQLVPVHLIATTSANAQDADGASVERDIDNGIGETGIRTGLVVADAGSVLAASRSMRSTGVPLLLDVDTPDAAMQAIERVRTDGGAAGRVIAGGFAANPGAEEALQILEAGAYLSLDRVGQDGQETDRVLAELVVSLDNAGFGDRLLLSQRLADQRRFTSRGGSPGWIHLQERFALQVLDAGGDGMLVRRLLIDNQAAALSTVPAAGAR